MSANRPNPPHGDQPNLGDRISSSARTWNLALELPFTLIISVLAGGVIGWLIDRWLHKDFVFTLIFGALGFAAGITGVIRAVLRNEKRTGNGGNDAI